ncbi:MAG: nuclear transport factor 2 family protein [Sandaracinaceae bacterium]
MSRSAWLVIGLACALSACGASMLTATQQSAAESRVEEVIDAWHAAAARSDIEMYFGLMTEDAVFLGTDATERWDRAAFRAYADPVFAESRGWSMTSRRRTVEVDPHGHLAWFEEDLDAENLGPARGSGVLRNEPEGWRIVQYNLAITVPNDRFSEVRSLLSGPAD